MDYSKTNYEVRKKEKNYKSELVEANLQLTTLAEIYEASYNLPPRVSGANKNGTNCLNFCI